MSVRNKVVAAVLAAGALTAVVSVNVMAASASQPSASQSSAAPAAAGQEGNLQRAAKLLAAELTISVDRATKVLASLDGIVPKGDLTEEPRFVAIAKDLGVTSQRLEDALVAVKKQL